MVGLPGTVEHGFTHFRLELALVAARTLAPAPGIWATPAQFKDYALPTLTKLVNYARSAVEPPLHPSSTGGFAQKPQKGPSIRGAARRRAQDP